MPMKYKWLTFENMLEFIRILNKWTTPLIRHDALDAWQAQKHSGLQRLFKINIRKTK